MNTALEFIAGKGLKFIIVSIVSIIILIFIYQNDEGRKEKEFQRKQRQEKERFRAEMDALNKKDQYNSILNSPSLLGIEIFIEKYPEDARVGILKEIGEKIKLKERLNNLFSYIQKNQKASIDSMLVFCELADDSIQFNLVEEKLKSSFFDLTSNKISYNSLVDFMNRFPNANDEIQKLFKILEIVYFREAMNWPTNYNTLSYLKIIPDTLQKHNAEVIKDLKKMSSRVVNYQSLENKTFMSDPITIDSFGVPIMLFFKEKKGNFITTNLGIEDKIYNKCISKIEDNNLHIYTIEERNHYLFASCQLYEMSDTTFIESNYDSESKYFKLYEVN